MDDRQDSIIAQSSVKSAAELLSGTGATLGDLLEAATVIEEWVHGAGGRWAFGPRQEQPVAQPDPSVVSGCPKCGSEMWDNRFNKRNPKAPDYKCKNKACQHPIWLEAAAGGRPPF